MTITAWLKRARSWWQKIFFWQTPREGSQEFKPEAHHDHALVLSVAGDARSSRWNQLRFLNRVLPKTERHIFWICLGVAIVAVAVGLLDFTRPHLVTVPASGGAVTEAVIGTPKLINPLFAPLNDVDRDLAGLIYSGLFRIDSQLRPEPDLAESYRWNEDGTTLQVSLRKNARFHDNAPVKSDDVIFTYQTVRNLNWRSPLAANYRNLSVIRIDDQTIQFQLNNPDPTFLYNLTLGILPAHIWEDVSDVNAHLAEANIKPVGSGPYQVVSFTRDSKGAILTYRLRLFPQYYGIKPNIEEWNFHLYPDREQAVNAVRQNQVDSLAFVPWGEAVNVKNENFRTATLELPQETVAFFNVNDPILKDERIRQALDMAIDRDELLRLIGAHAEPAGSPFPFLIATTSTKADLDGARTLLDKINWILKPGEDVRSFSPTATAPATSSTPFSIVISVPDQPDLKTIAELLKRRWSLLGAHTDVVSVEPETLKRDVLTNRKYQVLVTNVLVPPNQDISTFWNSNNAVTHGYNLSNLADREVDLALEKFRTATSTDGWLAAQRLLSDSILARTPALFLLRPTYAYLISKQIQGVQNLRISQPEDRLRQTNNWYVKTKWGWE